MLTFSGSHPFFWPGWWRHRAHWRSQWSWVRPHPHEDGADQSQRGFHCGSNQEVNPLFANPLVSPPTTLILIVFSRIFSNARPLLTKSVTQGSQGAAGLKDLVVKNNLDFYRDTNILTFFNDVGRHFRVSNMLAKERCG